MQTEITLQDISFLIGFKKAFLAIVCLIRAERTNCRNTLMGIERREHERKPMRGQARITINNKPPIIVSTLDIGIGGMAVVSDLNIAAKQACKIEFNILLRKTGEYCGVRTLVMVTYSAFSNSEQGFKLGLQFMGLSDHGRAAVRQYLGIPDGLASPPVINSGSDTDNAEKVQWTTEQLSFQ